MSGSARRRVRVDADSNSAIENAFRIFDQNCDGSISPEELKRVLQTLNPLVWSDKNIDSLVETLTGGTEGHVSFDVFAEWISKEGATSNAPTLETKDSSTSQFFRHSLSSSSMFATRSSILEGYRGLRHGERIIIRCVEADISIANMLRTALENWSLSVEGVEYIPRHSEKPTIWVVTPRWSTSDVQEMQTFFVRGKALLLHPSGMKHSPWCANLVAEGSGGPTVDFGIGYAVLRRASVDDLDVLRMQGMSRLWSKLMKLMGVRAYRNENALCTEIYSICRSPSVSKRECTAPDGTPHVVGIVGSTAFFQSWTDNLMKYFAVELMELNRAEHTKEIILCTGGFRNMNERDQSDNQGVGYSAAKMYHSLGGHVIHVLPEVANEKDYSALADHLSDGSFFPVDHGVTLFAGQTNDERLSIMALACDIIFLVEGGPGAATQTKAAMITSKELIAVVPVRASGGAAAGMFGMPAMNRPLHVDKEAWAAVADDSIPVAETKTDGELQEMARAMASITWSTMHPVDGLANMHRNADPTVWAAPALAALKARLHGGVRICILGSTAFNSPDTEALVEALARKLDKALDRFHVFFITGGMRGVQETFAKSCGDSSRIWNLVPTCMKGCGGYGVGTDIYAGASHEERRQLIGAIGDIYITVEGGPGVAEEANFAYSRGAIVVPFMRSGGASSGMFEFPKGALERPDCVEESQWTLLADSSASVDASAEAACAVVVGIAEGMTSTHMLELPDWQLPLDTFRSPLSLIQAGELGPFHRLLRLCEKSFRMYGRWSRVEVSNLRQILDLMHRFLSMYVWRSRTERHIEQMKVAYKDGGSKYRRVYSTIVEDVIASEDCYDDFVAAASSEARRLSASGIRASQRTDSSGFDLLLDVYRDAYRATNKLEEFCTRIASASGAKFLKAPLKRMWRSLEKMVVKYSTDDDMRHAAAELKDVARGAIQGNMRQLKAALALIAADREVCLVRLKNRFAEPSDMGWADVQVMLYFHEDDSKHICEIQLVHHQLMIVRSNMGAHHEYASVRAAGELLSFFKERVPSLTPKAADHMCKVRPSVVLTFPPQLTGRLEPAWPSPGDFEAAHGATTLGVVTPGDASSKTAREMGIALGIADASMPMGGRVSLRWENEEFVVFDDPYGLSPLHLVVMPTAWYIPTWCYLLKDASLAKEILEKMKSAAVAATAEFLRHEAWRDQVFAEPEGGWAAVLDGDLHRFCAEHVIAGFEEPPDENQLCLQWILPPVFPWKWCNVVNDDSLTLGHWIPLEYVETLINQPAADILTSSVLEHQANSRSPSKAPSKAVHRALHDKKAYKDAYKQSRSRYAKAQDNLVEYV